MTFPSTNSSSENSLDDQKFHRLASVKNARLCFLNCQISVDLFPERHVMRRKKLLYDVLSRVFLMLSILLRGENSSN